MNPSVSLTIEGKTVTWHQADDGGWDAVAVVGGRRIPQEKFDKLTFTGVSTVIAGLLTHPEDIG